MYVIFLVATHLALQNQHCKSFCIPSRIKKKTIIKFSSNNNNGISTHLSADKELTLDSKFRRRRGLPRSKIGSAANLHLQQRLVLFVKRFVSELSCAFILLSIIKSSPILKRLVLKSCIRTNVLRWAVLSLAIRLLLVYSEITSSTPNMSRGENAEWFLPGTYNATSDKCKSVPVRIRQVPGNGSCLFLAIAAGVLYNESLNNDVGQHPTMAQVKTLSTKLRNQAVDAFVDGIKYGKSLVMQQDEIIKTAQLVQLAASQYNLTVEQYLNNMRDAQVWGGGPEIVVLANTLKCNIVLLEENRTASDINLKVSARFGPQPKVPEHKSTVYILSAHQDFPKNVRGDNVKDNHFLAVFPTTQL